MTQAKAGVKSYAAIFPNTIAIGIVVLLIAVFFQQYPEGLTYSQALDELSSAIKHKYVLEAVAFNEYLEGAFLSLPRPGYPPISFLDLCGSILTCMAYRSQLTSRKSWFESLVSCTLMQFGGTTLTGWLLGQTPSWIVSHSAFPALVISWWLTFFCPFDLFFTMINSFAFRPALFIIGVFSSISGGHAVTSWGVDKALNNAFHVNHVRISQSVLTCIACGTFSSSGGGILCNVFRFYDKQLSYTLTATPGIFAIGNYGASATITRSFWLSCIYFLLLNTHSYNPWSFQAAPEFARFIISALQALHFVINTFFGVDVFQSFSVFLIHNVLLISPQVGPLPVVPFQVEKPKVVQANLKNKSK